MRATLHFDTVLALAAMTAWSLVALVRQRLSAPRATTSPPAPGHPDDRLRWN